MLLELQLVLIWLLLARYIDSMTTSRKIISIVLRMNKVKESIAGGVYSNLQREVQVRQSSLRVPNQISCCVATTLTKGKSLMLSGGTQLLQFNQIYSKFFGKILIGSLVGQMKIRISKIPDIVIINLLAPKISDYQTFINNTHCWM